MSMTRTETRKSYGGLMMIKHYTALFAFGGHYFYSTIEAETDSDALFEASQLARAAWLDLVKVTNESGEEVAL